MKTLLLLSVLCLLGVACSTSQSNNEAEVETEQLNDGDVIPNEAVDTPQNQNKTNKVKAISF